MKNQWRLMVGLVLVLLVVIFALLNIVPVPLNFGFFRADWPLVLVILGSLFIGVFTATLASAGTIFHLKKELKESQKELVLNKQKNKKEIENIEKTDSIV